MARKYWQTAYVTGILLALLITIGCGGATPAPIDGAGSDPAVAVSITPLTATVQAGTNQTFTATVSNTSLTKVGWTVNGIAGGNATIGTISSAGVYTAPPYIPSPAVVTVAAVSQADSTKSATAAVTVTGSEPGAGPHVTISPTQENVPLGTIVPFTATVQGITDTAVNFLVNGEPENAQTPYGSIAPELGSADMALYTAPLTLPGTTTVNITAELASDPSVFASATITLIALSGTDPVSIYPLQPTVEVGYTQTFTATVTGLSNSAVTWEVDGIAGGNATLGKIVAGPNNSATYTAPATPGIVTVTAVSVAEPIDTASAQVTIIPYQQITVTVSPSSANVVIDQTQQFTAEVPGDNQNVTWQVNGVTGGNGTVGTISTEGLYTAPATVPSPAVVTVTAISQVDSQAKGTAAVTITPAPVISVTISPLSASVQVNDGQNFTATVINSTNPDVTWEVNGEVGGDPTIGTITPDEPNWTATYIAPATVPNPDSVAVTAVSVADPTKSASAIVTIVPPTIQVMVNPAQATVVVGQMQQFGATVIGSPDQIVYWSLSGQGCSGAACGTINSSGEYQAPPTVPNPPTVTVIATADANPSVYGTATVTVTQNAEPSIAIFPNPPSPIPAGTASPLTFTAIITNAPSDTDVSWQLGCISLYNGDPGENCNDNEFGGGPGCITVTNGFQVCGDRPNVGPGNEPLLYDSPHNLFTNDFAPNSCEPTNNGSGDGLVPLTASMNLSGCPQGLCQATVCITVTP